MTILLEIGAACVALYGSLMEKEAPAANTSISRKK
jgi:hypothetical protein